MIRRLQMHMLAAIAAACTAVPVSPAFAAERAPAAPITPVAVDVSITEPVKADTAPLEQLVLLHQLVSRDVSIASVADSLRTIQSAAFSGDIERAPATVRMSRATMRYVGRMQQPGSMAPMKSTNGGDPKVLAVRSFRRTT